MDSSNLKSIYEVALLLNAENVCRFCLQDRDSMANLREVLRLNNDMGQPQRQGDIPFIYETVTSFKLEMSTDYPPNICKQCEIDLRRAFETRRKLIEIDVFLKDFIAKHRIAPDAKIPENCEIKIEKEEIPDDTTEPAVIVDSDDDMRVTENEQTGTKKLEQIANGKDTIENTLTTADSSCSNKSLGSVSNMKRDSNLFVEDVSSISKKRRFTVDPETSETIDEAEYYENNESSRGENLYYQDNDESVKSSEDLTIKDIISMTLNTDNINTNSHFTNDSTLEGIKSQGHAHLNICQCCSIQKMRTDDIKNELAEQRILLEELLYRSGGGCSGGQTTQPVLSGNVILDKMFNKILPITTKESLMEFEKMLADYPSRKEYFINRLSIVGGLSAKVMVTRILEVSISTKCFAQMSWAGTVNKGAFKNLIEVIEIVNKAANKSFPNVPTISTIVETTIRQKIKNANAKLISDELRSIGPHDDPVKIKLAKILKSQSYNKQSLPPLVNIL